MSQVEKTIYFTRGVPPGEAFPLQQLKACAETVLENHSSTVLQYHPAIGYLPLREWLGQRYNVSADKILIGNGSLQLQTFLVELLTSPGDVVLVEKPSYDRAITAFRMKGLEALPVPLESDGFNLEILERIVKEKNPKFFYIIPDFQNPSGITTSQTKREKLIELAEKYDFWILEDNPYRDLRYCGEELTSLFALRSKKVFFFSSFSKLLSPGMRVGYLIGPLGMIEKTAKIAEDTYITPNMLSQGIVFDYCRRGWLETGIARLRDLYRPKLETLVAALEVHMPEADYTRPAGGFFLGMYLPEGVEVNQFRSKARQQGVILSNGNGFFADGDGDGFVRLPFCALSDEELKEGVRRLGEILG